MSSSTSKSSTRSFVSSVPFRLPTAHTSLLLLQRMRHTTPPLPPLSSATRFRRNSPVRRSHILTVPSSEDVTTKHRLNWRHVTALWCLFVPVHATAKCYMHCRCDVRNRSQCNQVQSNILLTSAVWHKATASELLPDKTFQLSCTMYSDVSAHPRLTSINELKNLPSTSSFQRLVLSYSCLSLFGHNAHMLDEADARRILRASPLDNWRIGHQDILV